MEFKRKRKTWNGYKEEQCRNWQKASNGWLIQFQCFFWKQLSYYIKHCNTFAAELHNWFTQLPCVSFILLSMSYCTHTRLGTTYLSLSSQWKRLHHWQAALTLRRIHLQMEWIVACVIVSCQNKMEPKTPSIRFYFFQVAKKVTETPKHFWDTVTSFSVRIVCHFDPHKLINSKSISGKLS